MRFALFGTDRAALAVAHGVAALPGHELIRFVGQPQSLPRLPAYGAKLRCCRSWEELLPDADIDSVIVTGDGDEKQNAVRQLVLAGKSVLLTPALTQPASFFYELALIEAESPGSLFPLLGQRGHRLILKLRQVILENRMGRLRHARLERLLAPSAAAGDSLLTEEDIARALLGDADLLRTLCGAYDQLTASRSGDSARGFSLATVTLAGSAAPQAVWTAAATAGENEWRLTLSGDCGTAVLEGEPDRAWFRLTLNLDGQPASSEEGEDDAGPWLVEEFTASIDRDRSCGAANEARSDVQSTVSLWGELARDVELVDAVERSVRRRRTIDVHFETPSERGLFKTQMTAIGCCLLVLTPAAIVIYLAVAATVEFSPLLKKILVALLFLPLGLFLALQLLVFVSRPASRDNH